jgi:membrane protease YdiL (CAAX protease family)
MVRDPVPRDSILRPVFGGFERIAPLIYLSAIGTSELLTVLVDPRLGVSAHAVVLFSLIIHASFTADASQRRLFLALTLAPLIRILSLSMPLDGVAPTYWFMIVAVPLLAAAMIVARTLSLGRRDLGLVFGFLPTQLVVAATGVGLGIVEYLILKPEPLIDNLSLGAVLLPALILMVGTGFTEEFVFRGVMQSAARDKLGRASLVYVSAVFAVMHVGFESALDIGFVFLVALFFSWVVLRTGSIFGVAISHGITNAALLLVIPFTGLAAASG